MKLALIATGRWASVGPGFAQVSEPGAWLSPLKLDRSPLGAPSPKISLERSQSPPQGLRIPPSDSQLPRLCLIPVLLTTGAAAGTGGKGLFLLQCLFSALY